MCIRDSDIVVHFLVSEVKVAVLQTDVLTGFAGSSNLERELLGDLAENADFLRLYLYGTGFDLVVVGALITLEHSAGDGNRALLVDTLQQGLVVEHHLYHTVVVAQVDEHDSAVVTDILHPAGNSYFLAYIVFCHRVAVLRAVFVLSEQLIQSFQI